jgi:myosin heavy subunit
MAIPEMDKLKDKEKLAVFQQRIEFQNETIENQKKQIETSKDEITQLKSQIDRFSISVQSQTSVIADQQKTLKDQETTLLEQQMSISNLQKTMIELQKKLEDTSTKLNKADATCNERVEKLKVELVEIKKTLQDKEIGFNKKIEEREETIKTLRTQITVLERGEKELTQLQEKITAGDSRSLEKRTLDMEKALQDADEIIASLEKEIAKNKQTFQEELKIRDVKIEEYERIIRKQGPAVPLSTNMVFDRDTSAAAIISIFNRTKSNVMVFLPDIHVLDKLDFTNLRPTARVQLAIPAQQNPDLINKLATKSNMEIRNYTEGIIWGIIRDNEEILLAPLGENNEPSGLIVKGDIQIDMFSNIMRSTWTRLKHV